MPMINLLESCKGLTSLIRGRTKRKEKSAFQNDNLTVTDACDLTSELSSSLGTQTAAEDFQPLPSSSSQPSQDNHGVTGLGVLAGREAQMSSSSLLSHGTRYALKTLYQQWENELDCHGPDDEDEDEELASDLTKFEDRDLHTYHTYGSTHHDRLFSNVLSRNPSSSTYDLQSNTTLCTDVEEDSPKKFLRESDSSQSIDDYISNHRQRTNDDQDDSLSTRRNTLSLAEEACPFPIASSPSNPLVSDVGMKKELKRVKSIRDFKNIKIDTSHGTVSYSRKRRSGMIGGNFTELNSRLKAMSIMKKTSHPMLRLKISLSSLNNSLHNPFGIPGTECGLYASNFIEVLDYDPKRVHEIELGDSDLQEDKDLNANPDSPQVETCSVDSNPSISKMTCGPTFVPTVRKRVHFLEPLPSEDGSILEPCQSINRTRFFGLCLTPNVSSYCQRKKQDWSHKLKTQCFNAKRSNDSYM